MTKILALPISNTEPYHSFSDIGRSSEYLEINSRYLKAKNHYLSRPSLFAAREYNEAISDLNFDNSGFKKLINVDGVSSKTAVCAIKLINKLRSIAINEHLWWQKPLINAGNDIEVVLEWWNKKKKLTVYVSESTAEFIKVWGSDIDDDMEDGSIDSDDTLKSLWAWMDT